MSVVPGVLLDQVNQDPSQARGPTVGPGAPGEPIQAAVGQRLRDQGAGAVHSVQPGRVQSGALPRQGCALVLQEAQEGGGLVTPEQLVALWQDTVVRSRSLVTEALADGGLDQPSRRTWPDGRAPSLRWILVHMIEEYARHNGHADLLRESVDGLTGE